MGEVYYNHPMNPHAVLPRYAAMCGFFEIPPMDSYDKRIYEIEKIEIPDELIPKILALHFSEKANSDLRAMGEGIGKINISLPSNINVWQHLKGESSLASAAKKLTEAVSAIATT